MKNIDKDLLDQELNEDVLENVNGGTETTYIGSEHAADPDLPKVALENQEEHAKDPK